MLDKDNINTICGFVILCFISDKLKKLPMFYALTMTYVLYKFLKPRSSKIQLHILDVDGINETVYIETILSGKYSIFMLDTGYAGPPVLSSSYLALNNELVSFQTIEHHIFDVKRRLQRHVSLEDQHNAVNSLLKRGDCVSYTSGCTMKLMSIGATVEQQADMLMCDMLKMKTTSGTFVDSKTTRTSKADVFVTNPLPQSVHILTCDFLIHSAPCIISLSQSYMQINMSLSEISLHLPMYNIIPFRMSGGAFVTPITVGGVEMFCTVDTGAPGPICLGANAVKRMTTCKIHTRGRISLNQTGVNNERICSEILSSDVEFCGKSFNDLPILVNDSDVDGVDGYVGLGFLRGFDILILTQNIGFRPNGLNMKTFSDFESVAQKGGCNIELGCLN